MQMTMKESKSYPYVAEEDGSCLTAQESAAGVAYAHDETVMPNDVDYANIADGVLQVTPDIEGEIEKVDRGETVSMSEFKTIFSQWL